jgi:pimeloyl-ACP methyl ester carboxylesterase
MGNLLPRILGAAYNTLALVTPRLAGRMAFERFCRPGRPAIKPHHRNWLEQGKAFTLPHASGLVQGYRWGNGPRKLLFLHGWQSHAYFWKHYVEALPAEYTAYAFDAPGHGLSGGSYFNLVVYSEVIEAFLAKHGPMDAIVGHSLGGFGGIYTLARLPQFQSGQFAVLAMPGEMRAFWNAYYQFIGLWPRTQVLVDAYAAKRLGHSINYFSAIAFAKSLSLPGLLVYDDADTEATPAYAERLQAAWPQAQLVVTQGLGHNLRHARVVDGVVGFLQQRVPRLETLARG